MQQLQHDIVSWNSIISSQAGGQHDPTPRDILFWLTVSESKIMEMCWMGFDASNSS